MDENDKRSKIAAMNAALRASGEHDFKALAKHWDGLSNDPNERSVEIRQILRNTSPVSFLGEDRIGIYYQKETGIGFANKPFQFVVGEVEANIFAELFDQINHQLNNKTVLKLMGKEVGFGTRSMEVKDLAKRLREATGLSSSHLMAKKGTLTLVGIKLSFRA